MTTLASNRQSKKRSSLKRGSLAVGVAATLLLAACGSEDTSIGSAPAESTQPTDTTQVASPETGETDEADETTEEESTESQEQPDVEQNYEQDPLADDEGQSLIDLALDITGPTDDISRELNRVGVAPQIRTPDNGAYIIDFGTTSAVDTEHWTADYSSRVSFLADGSEEDLRTFYETLFVADGWEVDGVETEQGSGGPITTVEFNKTDENDPLENLQLKVFKSGRFEGTIVSLRFLSFRETIDPAGPERLGQWASSLIPANATPAESTVSIGYNGLGFDLTNSQLQLNSSWTLDGSAEELTAQIKQAAAESGKEYTENLVGVDYAATDERPKLSLRSHDNRVEAQVVESYENVDPSAFVPSEASSNQDTDDQAASDQPASTSSGTLTFATTSKPLADNASASEIEDAILEVVGPTEDVSEVMARFGHFPTIETPDNAEIAEVGFQIGQVIMAEDLLAEVNSVSIESPAADPEALETFYEATLADAGWEQVGRSEQSSPDRTELSYSIAGSSPSSITDPLTLTISEDAASGAGVVDITYLHLFPREEVNLARWTGWYGSLPLLPDGQLENLAVSNFDTNREMQINFQVEYIYPKLPDDAAEQVTAALSGSDYKIGPEASTSSAIGLAHPDFDEATATPVARSLKFRMRRLSESRS